jgi:hypothetical protein
MGYELKNTQRSSSILRCVDPGTYTINLQDFAANTTNIGETINSASIKRINWSTNGSISITRNALPLLALHTAGEMRLDEYGHSIANNSTGNLAVTIVTGGSLVMEITKDTSYNVALTGF